MSVNFMATPPVFSGEHYEIWSLKMKTYLEVSGLWEPVNTKGQPLQADPTVAQIRAFNEETKTRIINC